MARIHDDDLRRLKENISIAEVCRSRGIELTKHGNRDLIGKCPLHQDENPSFVVSPHKNLFHCMGCGAAGSVIDLVMKLDGLDFRQAVDNLLGSTPKIKRMSSVLPEPTRPEKPSISPPSPWNDAFLINLPSPKSRTARRFFHFRVAILCT